MDADASLADQGNRAAPGQVEAPAWTNPTPAKRYDLVVIGHSVAGICAAHQGRRAGRRVALVSEHWRGSFDSAQVWVVEDALRRAAQVVHQLARGKAYGWPPSEGAQFDFAGLMARVGQLRRKISAERTFRALADSGIDFYVGQAVFTQRDALEVDGRQLKFRRAVLATGARSAPAVIDGADGAGCLTPEDFLELDRLPRSLGVIGTGPRQCCWAQTFRRLGSQLHLAGHAGTILPEHHLEAASLVQAQLEKEGVRLHLGCDGLRIERTGSKRAIVIEKKGDKEKLFLDQIIIDSPREPNTAGLGLEAAQVEFTDQGVVVGHWLQTTNRRIFAAGEVCGRQFSCPALAEAMGRLCVHNAFGRRRRRLEKLVVARCVRTDPEVIELGLGPAEAARQRIQIDTYRAELAEAGQALPEGGENGFVMVHVRRATGRIVGACVVAGGAGEPIAPLSLLISQKLTLAALADIVPCRPSRFELLKLLADRYAEGPQPSLRALLGETWRKRWRRLPNRAINRPEAEGTTSRNCARRGLQ